MENKVAVITGAAGGLGRASALRLASEGARIAATDQDEAGLAETVRMVKAAGGKIVANHGGITLPAAIDRTVAAAVRDFGGVHALCNIAGVLGAGGPVESVTTESFDQVIHVNCPAQILAIQCVLPEMRRAGGGSIVNIASIGALVALPFMAAYCASKSAVLGLTRAVALEAGPTIRCNAICPGGVDSPMSRKFLAQFDDREAMVEKLVGRQIIKRFAEPHEIAEFVLFLVSDESGFITGATLPAEAGHSAW